MAIGFQALDAFAELLLGPQWRVLPEDELLRVLGQHFGHNHVKVEYGRRDYSVPDVAVPDWQMNE